MTSSLSFFGKDSLAFDKRANSSTVMDMWSVARGSMKTKKVVGVYNCSGIKSSILCVRWVDLNAPYVSFLILASTFIEKSFTNWRRKSGSFVVNSWIPWSNEKRSENEGSLEYDPTNQNLTYFLADVIFKNLIN